MGLAGQHGPLAAASVGRFLTPSPLPGPLLFAEPLRRRMRVRFGELWIADSDDVVLLHEPGRYPVAYFPQHDVCPGVLIADGPVTRHPDLGAVTWLRVETAQHEVENAAWRYDSLPSHAAVLAGRVAFSWQAMTAFYEEDERIVGHATDFYHRVDIRATSRHLLVCDGERVVADTSRPLAVYRIGLRPALVCPPARHGRVGAAAHRWPNLLSLQGHSQLLQRRGADTRRLVLPQCLAGGGPGAQLGVLRSGQDRRVPRR